MFTIGLRSIRSHWRIKWFEAVLEEELNKTWQSKVNKSKKKNLNKLDSF